MLDLPDHAALDKARLLGGCVRLPLAVDAERLAAELRALPSALWGSPGGRVGVHRAAEAVFLRGFAPAEGDKPVADRDVLERLPYARAIIENIIPASPLRCLLARLPPEGVIGAHVDTAPYFAKTLRLHLPVESNPSAFMQCAGLWYRMAPGEVWALNNSTLHGVWNADTERSRTHLICDFLPSPELLALIAAGERDLGRPRPDLDRRVGAASGPY